MSHSNISLQNAASQRDGMSHTSSNDINNNNYTNPYDINYIQRQRRQYADYQQQQQQHGPQCVSVRGNSSRDTRSGFQHRNSDNNNNNNNDNDNDNDNPLRAPMYFPDILMDELEAESCGNCCPCCGFGDGEDTTDNNNDPIRGGTLRYGNTSRQQQRFVSADEYFSHDIHDNNNNNNDNNNNGSHVNNDSSNDEVFNGIIRRRSNNNNNNSTPYNEYHYNHQHNKTDSVDIASSNGCCLYCFGVSGSCRNTHRSNDGDNLEGEHVPSSCCRCCPTYVNCSAYSQEIGFRVILFLLSLIATVLLIVSLAVRLRFVSVSGAIRTRRFGGSSNNNNDNNNDNNGVTFDTFVVPVTLVDCLTPGGGEKTTYQSYNDIAYEEAFRPVAVILLVAAVCQFLAFCFIIALLGFRVTAERQIQSDTRYAAALGPAEVARRARRRVVVDQALAWCANVFLLFTFALLVAALTRAAGGAPTDRLVFPSYYWLSDNDGGGGGSLSSVTTERFGDSAVRLKEGFYLVMGCACAVVCMLLLLHSSSLTGAEMFASPRARSATAAAVLFLFLFSNATRPPKQQQQRRQSGEQESQREQQHQKQERRQQQLRTREARDEEGGKEAEEEEEEGRGEEGGRRRRHLHHHHQKQQQQQQGAGGGAGHHYVKEPPSASQPADMDGLPPPSYSELQHRNSSSSKNSHHHHNDDANDNINNSHSNNNNSSVAADAQAKAFDPPAYSEIDKARTDSDLAPPAYSQLKTDSGDLPPPVYTTEH